MKLYNPMESPGLKSDTLQSSQGTTLMQRESLKALMSCYFLGNE